MTTEKPIDEGGEQGLDLPRVMRGGRGRIES